MGYNVAVLERTGLTSMNITFVNEDIIEVLKFSRSAFFFYFHILPKTFLQTNPTNNL